MATRKQNAEHFVFMRSHAHADLHQYLHCTMQPNPQADACVFSVPSVRIVVITCSFALPGMLSPLS